MVPFEMVAKIFKDMTSEGGKFFNMQAVQAETLKGKISNLKDAYEVLLNEIGKSQSENLKNAVDWARRLMQNYEETGRKLVELIAAYGAYKAAIIAMEVVSGTFALANHNVLKSLVNIGKALTKNPYAVIAAGITALGFSIYKSATQLEAYEKIQKSLANTNKKFSQSLNTEQAKLEMLYNNLKLAKEGTKEYDKARKAIYANYASYISDLKNEGIAVDNLAGVYDKLKEKVEASTKARFRGVAAEGVNSTYGNVTQGLLNETERATERLLKETAIEFDSLQKQAIQAYVSGVLSMEDLESDSRLQHVANILKLAAESGNDEWMQFGTSIEYAQQQFSKATNTWVEQMAAIDKVYGKMEDTLDKDGKGLPPFGGDDDGEAENRIQSEIDAVRRLKDAYDTLAPYMNGEMLRKTLTALFPDADQQLIQSLDFRAKLVELARQLSEFDPKAAQKLKDSLSGEKAGEIANLFKEIEKYKKTLDSWMGEDFNLTGEGVSFDISKIVRDMNNQIAKGNQKAIQASELLTKAQMGDEEALKVVREVYGEEVWEKYLINGQKTIDELAKKEREAAKRTADEKIRDLADKFVKEQMDKKNIDLSDMEDKSVAQIQSLIARMKEIQEEAKKMSQESLAEVLLGEIDEGQYAQWQMMLDVIDQLRQKIDDTEEELNDKILDTTLDGIDAISRLGGEIASLGEAVGNSDLAKLGQTMERTAQAASGIIKALEADDTVSLVSNIVSYVIGSITQVFTEAYQQQLALNDATKEYRQLLLDIRREAYSGIFGTDEIGLAAENAKILAEAQKQYDEALSKFEDEKKLRKNKYTDTIALQKRSVADVLNEIASLQGWSLYDEAGELDLEALKANYDAYYDYLTNKQKTVVDAVIAGYDAQDEAARHSAEYLTELFSGVADNIAENMIDAFLESGDAAIDMGDVISDVSRKMVADLIKSIYLMPILNNYKEQFDAIESDQSLSPTEKTEAHLRNLDSALYEISNKSDEITAALEGFEEYFGSGETGTKDLGESIQGITEDQANLLASYLNAIRADVSSSKAIWSRMDGNLQRIADMFASSPTLMEYQAQIAANTYNTAIATQEILGELRSVITTDSGDTAIRVYS